MNSSPSGQPPRSRRSRPALAWPGRRRAQRAAAIAGYLDALWAIAPGAWWDDRHDRYRCSNPLCRHPGGLHPDGDGPPSPTRDRPGWARTPTTILLATGQGVDAIELSPTPALDTARAWALTHHHGPVSAINTSLFLLCQTPAVTGRRSVAPAPSPAHTATAHTLQPGRAGAVIVHGDGSWIPLPPSRLHTGDARWVRHPEHAGWALPVRQHVLDLLAQAHGESPDRT